MIEMAPSPETDAIEYLRPFYAISKPTLRFIGVLLLVLTVSSKALGQQPTMTLELVPQTYLDHRQAQLYITIESSQDLSNAVLQINPSTDFDVNPSTISLPSITRNLIVNATVSVKNERLLGGNKS